MKKLLCVLFLSIVFFSCSPGDDEVILSELVPINSVDLPETFIQGETYTFIISYTRPTSCHAFAGFDFTSNENERIIGVVNDYFPENGNCEPGEYINEASLDFHVERNDFYIFRFWQGEDEDGEPLFLSVEIPVEQ